MVERIIENLIESEAIWPSAICGPRQSEKNGIPIFQLGKKIVGKKSVHVEQKEFRNLVSMAIKEGKATIVCQYQVEIDRKDSPGYPDYMWYETNVKYEYGSAILTLDLTSENPVLIVSEYLVKRTEWTGY